MAIPIDDAHPTLASIEAVPEVTEWTPGNVIATLRGGADHAFVLSISRGQAHATSGRELLRRVLGAATALRAAGISQGDVVAICAPNSAEWIAAGLACHTLGAILAPIDALLGNSEVRERWSRFPGQFGGFATLDPVSVTPPV